MVEVIILEFPLTTVTGVGFGADVNAVTNEQGGITSLTVDTAGEDYATGNQLSIAAGAVGGGTVIINEEAAVVTLAYTGGGTNTFPAGTYTFEDSGTPGVGQMTQVLGTNGDNLSIRFSVAEPGNTLPTVSYSTKTRIWLWQVIVLGQYQQCRCRKYSCNSNSSSR